MPRGYRCVLGGWTCELKVKKETVTTQTTGCFIIISCAFKGLFLLAYAFKQWRLKDKI